MIEKSEIKINCSEINTLLNHLNNKLNKINIIIEEDLIQQEVEQRNSIKDNSSNIKKMTFEIERFIESNMREMYKEIVLIRKCYEDELIGLMELDSGYNELINSVKNEMNSEEESIKNQYELSRLKGVELILERYRMNKISN